MCKKGRYILMKKIVCITLSCLLFAMSSSVTRAAETKDTVVKGIETFQENAGIQQRGFYYNVNLKSFTDGKKFKVTGSFVCVEEAAVMRFYDFKGLSYDSAGTYKNAYNFRNISVVWRNNNRTATVTFNYSAYNSAGDEVTGQTTVTFNLS